MSLFSEFRTCPKVQNRSKRHFAKFLPFAGLCDSLPSLQTEQYGMRSDSLRGRIEDSARQAPFPPPDSKSLADPSNRECTRRFHVFTAYNGNAGNDSGAFMSIKT